MPTRPPQHRAPGLADPAEARRLHDHHRRDDPDRRFLQSRIWREKIRPAQLMREPLCRFCKALGIVQAADHVDHIRRPRGDRRLQTDPSNFQSLCADHHQQKSLWERRADGKPLQIGAAADGWPIEAPGGTLNA